MKKRRKIIVYIATSVDGYIAKPNGDMEWLNRRPRKADYGMRRFYSSIDTILLGRKTYDWTLDYCKKNGIDEFDIHVIPTFIGQGIPLIAPRHRDISLHLRSARKYPDGVVRLRYEIAR
ncbi:MAG: hypothetical protein DMG63_11025 [Acidobacteria bacterium]|nr:MAG: hypothetical protein DMG63_11025 [Acidobacteriota bacterium]